MQESIIIVTITVLSSIVTISRFLYEYRKKCSCRCTRKSSDVIETEPVPSDTQSCK